MEDIIKREAALSKCDYCNHVEMCGWRKDIEEQGCEFFDDGSKWIPCSERLPEESGDYLVTYEWVEASGTRYTEVEIVPFAHNRWEFFIDPEEVLAWMPLPEPWKGADDE